MDKNREREREGRREGERERERGGNVSTCNLIDKNTFSKQFKKYTKV